MFEHTQDPYSLILIILKNIRNNFMSKYQNFNI